MTEHKPVAWGSWYGPENRLVDTALDKQSAWDGNRDITIVPLYDASLLSEYEDKAKTAAHLSLTLAMETARAEAAEAEAKRLREALEEGRRAIGDHFAPNDCYATGPLTGNEYRDLIECPACSFIGKYEAVMVPAALGASR